MGELPSFCKYFGAKIYRDVDGVFFYAYGWRNKFFRRARASLPNINE